MSEVIYAGIGVSKNTLAVSAFDPKTSQESLAKDMQMLVIYADKISPAAWL